MHAEITVLNPFTHPHTYPYALAYLFTLHLALRPIPKGSYENTRLTFRFSWYKYQCIDTPKVVPSDVSEVNLACLVTIFNEVRSQNPIKMSNQECVSETPGTSPSISPSVETLRLHLSGDVPLMEDALIPSFPQDIASPVSQYSFLRDLQGSDLTVSEPTSFQPILPYPESLQRSEASTSSMVREEPNFMTMVRGMRQKLFGRARGRLMGRDDPPEEKALVREWTREMKKIYGSSTTASMSHTRVSSNYVNRKITHMYLNSFFL